MKFEAPPADNLGAGGASQLHALNSSIMNLGLENFWAKGNCFAKYDVELAKSVALEKPEKASCID